MITGKLDPLPSIAHSLTVVVLGIATQIQQDDINF